MMALGITIAILSTICFALEVRSNLRLCHSHRQSVKLFLQDDLPVCRL